MPKKLLINGLFFVLIMTACGTGGVAGPSVNFTPDAPPTSEQSTPGQPGQEEQVAAFVNGVPIYLEEFNRELARFEAGQTALGFQISDEAGYRQQILDLLVEQELIRQLAASQGIVISDEVVDNEILTMVEENGREYFDSWLEQNYYTEAEFRELLRLELVTSALLEPVISTVPDMVEHVHARHILVNTEVEAEAVMAQLQQGQDFASLAATFSIDATTRTQGGDLGWFPRGVLLVSEVEDVAFSQSPGQVSGIIASAWGYHIVQTLEFNAAMPIDAETRQRLVKTAVDTWRAQIRAGAAVQQLIQLNS